MRYVGIDLAWSRAGRGRTGLCVADANGHVVGSALAGSDDEIHTWLQPRLTDECLVAIDAPLVVPNDSGSRLCERMINDCFGKYEAGCHSSNDKMAYFQHPRGADLAARLGLSLDPKIPATGPIRNAIEVYPHPSQVVLFNLNKTLKYKAKRGRSIESRRAEFDRYLKHLEDLGGGHPSFDVRQGARWNLLEETVEQTGVGAEIDRVEDELDAYFCAYLAMYYVQRSSDCRVIGTLQQGYIVTPVRDSDAHCLDARDRWNR